MRVVEVHVCGGGRAARFTTGAAEHGGETGAGKGRGGGIAVDLLEGVEFGEKGVEAAEEFARCGGVEVVDGGDGEAEEEVVCGFAGEFARFKGGHAGEVGAFKEVCVEPVDAAFVSV